MRYLVIRRTGYASNMVLPSTEVVFQTDEWETAMKKVTEQERAWFKQQEPESPITITFAIYESV